MPVVENIMKDDAIARVILKSRELSGGSFASCGRPAKGAAMAISWSGGKDSCLLLKKALAAGFRVQALFNLIDGKELLSITPPFNMDMAALQAEAVGLPLIRQDVSGGPRKALGRLFSRLKKQGIGAIGISYIDRCGQRDCVMATAAAAGIKIFEPLCGKDRGLLLEEVLDSGIKAMIVGVDPVRIDPRLLGKFLCGSFRKYLERMKVDLCGENGEYHTIVLDCPLFKKKLEVKSFRIVEACGLRYFVIKNAVLKAKTVPAPRFPAALGKTFSVRRLDLKTNFNCNNLCLFCAQGHKRNCIAPKSLDEITGTLKRERKRGIRGVVFTGGEPTLHPDLPRAVKAARELGYTEVQVQTNARRLVYPDYCSELKDAGVTEIAPALHGSCAKTHDGLTRCAGSFVQTVKGMINAKKAGMSLVANIVVTSRNYRELPELAYMLLGLKVDHFQFAFVHPIGSAWSNRKSIVPRITDAIPYIKRGLAAGIKAGVSCCTEAIPLCLMQGYEKRIGERVVHLGPVEDADIYMDNFDPYRRESSKAKTTLCAKCVYFRYCEGPWKEYPEIYGWDEFVPVLKLP